ncbi:SGNH/GDSL hydrolase family protein [Undibacterium sp. Ji83W]|uniref:SGNH/GDSL hydrolase family protein n=1 Tax=Undibacterium sp. Ji83W TaxID=3413043 RepID=UPI003BF36823
MRHAQKQLYTLAASLLLTTAISLTTTAHAAAQPDWHWVSSWGAAQQIPEPENMLPAANWRDASLRQIVHVSLGGSRVRVRFSNVFGGTPLFIDSASLARAIAPGKTDIDTETLQALKFSGRSSVMIPAGSEYYSDAVNLQHAPASDLAISMYFKGEPVRQTSHPGSRANSFFTKGNRILDPIWQDAGKVAHWYQIADIEVQAPRNTGAVVAIGDSITDGHGATTDGNNRWPDLLSARLMKEGMPAMAVVNTGIGGGRMLRDGTGPNLASRFDRDVILRSGVTHAIIMIGVNDLGGQHRNGDDIPEARKKMMDDLFTAHRQLVERAHAHGICVIGATITPYTGSDYYRPGLNNEEDRQAVNAWIRNSGVFDAVADFDAAIRDPAQAEYIRKDYHNGDFLHPSPAGFLAMANAVPLPALQKCEIGR